MDCTEALPLIASYHDGELSEAQAAPLRQHLMDCPACRKTLAGEKTFKRWFPKATEEIEVPPGFAQRVARRAFAGDTGSDSREVGEPALAQAEGATTTETPIFSFVLWATALAAGMLLVVSGMLFQSHVGEGANLHADGQGMTKSELLQRAKLLSDPAGSVGFGEAPLEDMSDKSTKRSESDGAPAGEPAPTPQKNPIPALPNGDQ